MLCELYIKNYLLLPEIRLKLMEGLTVISGETGAGKSILVGSISLIFGDNSPGLEAWDKDKPIYLEATFLPAREPALVALLSDSGINTEDELIIAREIGTAGKSSYFMNGRKVGVSLLKELKNHLIDFHHQRDQQRLLSPAYQLELLDAYAGTDVLRSDYAELYHNLKNGLKHLETLKAESKKQMQLNELFQFQYEELEKAKLSIGEDVGLQKEYELLSHGLEITDLGKAVQYSLLEGENSIFDQLCAHQAQLQRYEKLNNILQKASQSLIQAMEAIQETSALLADLGDNLIAEPDKLEQIKNRLDTINALVFKHKVRSIAELINLFEERAAQIDAFAELEESISAAEKQLGKGFTRLKALGDELSAKRQTASLGLSQQLQEDIRSLSIPEGLLEIRIDKKAPSSFVLSEFIVAVSESGQDSVEFFFSANPGFMLKPLAAVVSGGELSRILLAIKKVLSQRILPKLMILDEIDAGIGGKTAERVAGFIHDLAGRQQVLCITHLAQIAAHADCHISIEKSTKEQRSTVSLNELSQMQRLQEIARMLSGSVSSKALEHAKELIIDIHKRGKRG